MRVYRFIFQRIGHLHPPHPSGVCRPQLFAFTLQCTNWHKSTEKKNSIHVFFNQYNFDQVYIYILSAYTQLPTSFAQPNSIMYSLALLCCVTIVMGCVSCHRLCGCAGSECYNVDPDTCKYGVVRNICHRSVCAKGPGERCSSSAVSRLGKCAEGLMCACNECVGCDSTSKRCFYNDCTDVELDNNI